MRHLATALVLACVLSGTASAGEIPTTGATAPQPPSSVAVAGEIHTVAGEDPGTDVTAESTLALTIVLTLLSIVR
jgi:hypothetical protein